MMHYDRVWVEIDLDAIVKNMTSIKNRIGKNVKVVAVIKTDGYGHGATQIARILETDEQVWGYAVATAEEAFSLREHDIRKPILILGYTFPYSYEQLIREDVRMAVFMDDAAQKLSERAVKLGTEIAYSNETLCQQRQHSRNATDAYGCCQGRNYFIWIMAITICRERSSNRSVSCLES